MLLTLTAHLFGWFSLLGPNSPEKLIQNYFEKKQFEVKLENKYYPNRFAHHAYKKIQLISDDQVIDGKVTCQITSLGFLQWRLSLPITEIEDIETRQYTLEEFGCSGTIIEILMVVMLDLYEGMSIIEIARANMLKTKHYVDLIEKYGIEPINSDIRLSAEITLHCDNEELYQDISHKLAARSAHTSSGFVAHCYDEPFTISRSTIHIGYGEYTLIQSNENDLRLALELHEGMLHYQLGLQMVQSFLNQQLSKYQSMLSYIQEQSQTSWLFVQRRMHQLQMKRLRYLELFEQAYTNYKNFNGLIHGQYMIEQLANHYHIKSELELYHTLKQRIQETEDMLDSMLSDRGEQEEKAATNSLIQIIGILAVVEVINGLLPESGSSYLNTVRIVILVSILPLLGLVWFRIQWKSRYMRRKAELLSSLFEKRESASGIRQYLGIFKEQAKASGLPEQVFKKEIAEMSKFVELMEKQVQDLEKSLK